MLRATAAVAAVIAVFLSIMYVRFSGDDESTVPVVVANWGMLPGTVIEPVMVRVVHVHEEEVAAGSYRQTSLVIGQPITAQIAPGEQLTRSKVGFDLTEVPSLGGTPRPGMRALSLDIDPAVNGERVRPGDWVDLLVATEGAGTATPLVKTLWVLAVTTDPSSVTVAVDAEQAVLVEDAQGRGSRLSLARAAVFPGSGGYEGTGG